MREYDINEAELISQRMNVIAVTKYFKRGDTMGDNQAVIGIVIATHGSLGEALVEAVELILGKQDHYKTIGLYTEDSVDDFQNSMSQMIDEMEEGKGVLCLVDMFGGSPYHVALQMMKAKKFACLTGTNLPMVLTAFCQRKNLTLEELENECLIAGKESHMTVEDIFRKSAEMNDNSETF